MKHLACIFALAVALCGCNRDDVIVDPVDYPDGFRPATAQSSPLQHRVFEYTPAPGQFINETATGGFSGAETTAEAACRYAERRLSEQKFVSLGAFGGYIVVGFDHSIASDFAILGNALDKSNEPGIVMVMQDTNRNGIPDDMWYELRGSVTDAPGTIRDYSVSYFRPTAPAQDVEWRDSEGNSGTIDYMPAYHRQDYYYPAWIAADEYTLTGTRLEARNYQDPQTGNWVNPPLAWGYADNLGSDALPDSPQWTVFKISNAIDATGAAVVLEYIDFVKVQSAVMAKSGPLGECSCEVSSFKDLSIR